MKLELPPEPDVPPEPVVPPVVPPEPPLAPLPSPPAPPVEPWCDDSPPHAPVSDDSAQHATSTHGPCFRSTRRGSHPASSGSRAPPVPCPPPKNRVYGRASGWASLVAST